MIGDMRRQPVHALAEVHGPGGKIDAEAAEGHHHCASLTARRISARWASGQPGGISISAPPRRTWQNGVPGGSEGAAGHSCRGGLPRRQQDFNEGAGLLGAARSGLPDSFGDQRLVRGRGGRRWHRPGGWPRQPRRHCCRRPHLRPPSGAIGTRMPRPPPCRKSPIKHRHLLHSGNASIVNLLIYENMGSLDRLRIERPKVSPPRPPGSPPIPAFMAFGRHRPVSDANVRKSRTLRHA